ncbi:cell surface receptor IPT/TIG domain protein [Gemmatirosa kalamazoonensis]|uniref:Cell surface receptor IPT/TIG domain protein n=1 Tax=Gemmatirosa kalamazoonensis TaxID=861299 RepID=W0RDP7_9BACT|nr:IPT/TIG domain-containing protein [Gemmatirosa kalamazoonensis]AHG88567.1 cell surface receptor IPT/TIG domain protein [Gemmatirosa kalamazoonensis]
MRPRLTRSALPALFLAAAGCGESYPTSWPSAPRAYTPPPKLTSISPNLGSTGGGAYATIRGTEIPPGASVTLGGVRVVGVRYDLGVPSGTAAYITTPAHAAGVVDLVVTEPGGGADTLVAAYTYVPPTSFDFNGTWGGFADWQEELVVTFRIEHDALVSVSCVDRATLRFATPPAVRDGAFSYRGADGVSVTGRIVMSGYAVGTLDLPPCTGITWQAGKSPEP